MTLFNRWERLFDQYAKVRTLNILRSMPERQLEDLGFSPELLQDGVKSWPWRQVEEPTGTTMVMPIAGNAAALDAGADASNEMPARPATRSQEAPVAA